jgi:hypothetical protein
VPPDITTKDLLRDSKLCANPPCCPGGRSPARLAAGLWAVCCAPVRLRPPPQPGGGGTSRGSDDGGGSDGAALLGAPPPDNGGVAEGGARV